MLESRDVLFIVLAFCALWFTAFLCWVMYQAAVLMRRLHGLVDEVKQRVGDLEESIIGMKRKFDGNVALITGLADGVKNIIASVRGRRNDE